MLYVNMSRIVAYDVKQAVAGNDTSMPPMMMTVISIAANIKETSIARKRVMTVEKLQNAGFTIPITDASTIIVYKTIASFDVYQSFLILLSLSIFIFFLFGYGAHQRADIGFPYIAHIQYSRTFPVFHNY